MPHERNFRHALTVIVMKGISSAFVIWLIILHLVILHQAQAQIKNEITQLINAGKYNAAISSLQKQTREKNDVEQLAIVYSQIGEIYYEYLHNYPEAIKAYKKIVTLNGISDSDLILSKIQLGNVYCRMGKYDDAIQIYQEIVNNYPATDFLHQTAQRKISNIKNALSSLQKQQEHIQNYANTDLAIQASFQIAELYRTDLNRPQKAIEQYRSIVEKYPRNAIAPESQWWIGQLNHKALHLEKEAISEYQQVIQNYPTSSFAAEAYFQIGRIYESQGKYQEALAAFNSIITGYPSFWKYPVVFYLQGECYEQLMDYSNAISAYKIFINVYLPDADPVRLGDIGKYGESKLKFSTEIEAKIRELQTDLPKVEWEKAQALTKKGDYQTALPILRKILSIAPESQYAQQAKNQLKRAEALAAIQQWQNEIDEQPQSFTAVIARFRIAETYEKELFDYQKAIAEYRKLIDEKQEPSWASKALYQIGSIYSHNLKNTNAAIETHQELIKKYPESREAMMAHYQLAEIYRSLNKYQAAIAAYQEIIAYPERNWYSGDGCIDSFADAAQFHIGVVNYENLRDYKTALLTFQKFIHDRPNSPRLAAAYVFIGLISEEQKNYQLAADSFEKAIDLVLNSNSVQASNLVNEVIFMDFGGLEPMTVLKRLRQKLEQINADKNRK
jgi:tetratricopeptide (TPR) repeat protein